MMRLLVYCLFIGSARPRSLTGRTSRIVLMREPAASTAVSDLSSSMQEMRAAMRAQAPPVLLIHGMHCTGEHWSGWRARLSQAGLEVHAPTLRHHDGYFSNVPGASQPPSARAHVD